jgi:hypothetical protein
MLPSEYMHNINSAPLGDLYGFMDALVDLVKAYPASEGNLIKEAIKASNGDTTTANYVLNIVEDSLTGLKPISTFAAFCALTAAGSKVETAVLAALARLIDGPT